MPTRRTVYRGAILDLVKLDDRWEIVEHAPAVAVLAMRDGRVLGVRQHRPAVERDTWELPAGLIDPGETPHEAAARELAEEAKLGGRLRPLVTMYSSPGFTDERVTLFEATELEPADGALDEHEELVVEWRRPHDVWEAAARGDLATSGPTLVGVRHAMAALDRGAPAADGDAPPPSERSQAEDDA